MNTARAVLWDMDGTLINSEEFHWISWRDTMANEGIAITTSNFFLRSASETIPSFPDGWVPHRLPSASRESQTPKRNSIAIWFARMGSHHFPELQVGCAGFTSRDGFRQLPRRRRVRTSR